MVSVCTFKRIKWFRVKIRSYGSNNPVAVNGNNEVTWEIF